MQIRVNRLVLVGEAQQIGGLCEREIEAAEILLGKFAPRVVEQLDEGCRLLLEAALARQQPRRAVEVNAFPGGWMA